MKKKYKNRGQPQYKMSGFDGGGASLTKKSLKKWLPVHYSSKSDLDANINILRSRAYDLVLNSPLGRAAINTSATGAISSGLRLFPRIDTKILGISANEAREWSRHTKAEFELWADSLNCDFVRRNTFSEIQNIVYRAYLSDGDCFCLFRRRAGDLYTLKLQIIEAGRVSNPVYNAVGLFNNVEMQAPTVGHRIINGIEVDKDGRAVAVWVSNKYWNELSITEPVTKWQRVKIYGDRTGLKNILHICADNRPDMYRGEPYLSPVVETLKNITRYADAELQSAIIRSFFTLFFTQPENNHDVQNILGVQQNTEDDKNPCVDPTEYKVGPGYLNALPRGVEVKTVNSSTQTAYDAFTTSFIMQIGAALNIPYEFLMKKFQSSYSASKAAMLQAEEEFRQRRNMFIQDFCNPVYYNFLCEAIALGRIKAEGFFENPLKRAAWLKADWRTESNHLLDPVKEVQASQLKIELGLSTYEHEAVKLNGTDFYDNVEQLKVEKALLKSISDV